MLGGGMGRKAFRGDLTGMVIHELGRRTEMSSEGLGIRALTPEDVSRLPLTWYHRHDRGEIRRLVRGFPGRSVWNPDTGEFALIGPWRHRTDIAQVAELSAQRSAVALIESAAAGAGHLGADLLVILESDERRRPSFYAAIDFEHLEDVVTLELDVLPDDAAATTDLTFVRVLPDSPEFAQVRRIDGQAFPWLWRNGPIEFETYIRMTDVRIYLGLSEGRPVSYHGVTLYRGWGHLDRIAVLPDLQGHGVGYQTLRHATAVMAQSGAETVGLSTQGHNHQSRLLYQRFGFIRQASNDYRIYGRSLGEEPLTRLLRRSPDDSATATDRDLER